MNWKSQMMVASILMVALALGCASTGGYGTTRVVEGGGMTLETLVNNPQNYDIYWAGIDPSTAVAVLFDPKNDGKTLQVGARWTRVSDLGTVKRMAGVIKQTQESGGFIPKLRAIVNPDATTFGYVYTGMSEMVITVIDDKTMRVESLG